MIPTNEELYTVSQLNLEVRCLLEEVFKTVWITGEISNLSRPSSGHCYFSLKDNDAQVRCALFRMQAMQMKCPIENGQQVIARARISLYEARGDFQLIIESMQPAGDGALQLAFEKLKLKLSKEGLFDEDHKQTIPKFPHCIGVITSPSGAAIRDILTVLKRRFPAIPIIIYPTLVQGTEAAAQIVAAFATANQRQECDVIILTRGGGSIEDLWSFNEESVARAIYASQIPIISAVGHEIDYTICDFVADARAATPSAAAECVSPDQQEWQQILTYYKNQCYQSITTHFKHTLAELFHLQKRLRHPGQRLLEQTQRLDQFEQQLKLLFRHMIDKKSQCIITMKTKLFACDPSQPIRHMNILMTNQQEKLFHTMQYYLKYHQQQLNNFAKGLEMVSPLKTLQRGYSITTQKDSKKIIYRASEVEIGATLQIQLSENKLECIITKKLI